MGDDAPERVSRMGALVALGLSRTAGKARNIYVSHIDIFRFYCYPNSRLDERIVPAGRTRTVGIEPTREARSDGSRPNISGLEARSKSGKRPQIGANRFLPLLMRLFVILEEMPWRCHSTNGRT